MNWKESIKYFIKKYQDNHWKCKDINKELIWDIIQIGNYDIREKFLYIYFPKTYDKIQFVLTIEIPENMEYNKFREEVSKFIKNRGDNMIVKFKDLTEVNRIVIKYISDNLSDECIIDKEDNITIFPKIIQIAENYDKYDRDIPGFYSHSDSYKFAHDFYYEIMEDIRNNAKLENKSVFEYVRSFKDFWMWEKRPKEDYAFFYDLFSLRDTLPTDESFNEVKTLADFLSYYALRMAFDRIVELINKKQ